MADNRAWRLWYGRKAWKELRTAQLRLAPLCAFCEAQGRIVAASVVDHVEPHRGDIDLFYDPANLQSLCKLCHDSAKAAEETRGYSDATGLDGYPLDPKHPQNEI